MTELKYILVSNKRKKKKQPEGFLGDLRAQAYENTQTSFSIFLPGNNKGNTTAPAGMRMLVAIFLQKNKWDGYNERA